MTRSNRMIGGAAFALGGLLVLGALVMNSQVGTRLQRTYSVEVEDIEIPEDQASIERGRHLVSFVFFCQECHGDQLDGRLYFDHPLTGRIAANNLTSGAGGVGGDYEPQDWVRAIHHGIGQDGRALIGMPSHLYSRIGRRDLGAIIAYLKTLPPVANELPERSVGPFTRISILGDPSLIPAEVIDHTAPLPESPDPGVTVEYGRYLSVACTVCHGENFAGGAAAGAGLDLTAGGDLADWSEEDFIRTIRTGVTPIGYELNPELMPWKRIGNMTDEELRAIWLYLKTLTGSPAPAP